MFDFKFNCTCICDWKLESWLNSFECILLLETDCDIFLKDAKTQQCILYSTLIAYTVANGRHVKSTKFTETKDYLVASVTIVH